MALQAVLDKIVYDAIKSDETAKTVNEVKPYKKETKVINYPKIERTSTGTLIEFLRKSVEKGLDEAERDNLKMLLQLVEQQAVNSWVRKAKKLVEDSNSVVLKRFFKKIEIDRK